MTNLSSPNTSIHRYTRQWSLSWFCSAACSQEQVNAAKFIQWLQTKSTHLLLKNWSDSWQASTLPNFQDRSFLVILSSLPSRLPWTHCFCRWNFKSFSFVRKPPKGGQALHRRSHNCQIRQYSGENDQKQGLLQVLQGGPRRGCSLREQAYCQIPCLSRVD